ncbi:MAG: glycosyltransferase [Planctomycetota bacterium]
MIFVTVGAQMPFERLTRTVDDWAGRRGRQDVFAQIGPTQWRPEHIAWTQFLDVDEFRTKAQAARVIVAHAGMGSIITALQFGKPILVMPRRGDLLETRNDHQVATAERFRDLGRVAVARDETELFDRLDRVEELTASGCISAYASPQLIDAIRRFIDA